MTSQPARRIWDMNFGAQAPLLHDSLSVSNVAVPLSTIPSASRRVIIRTLGQPINWTDDGVDPTASTGMALLSDEALIYDGENLGALKFIRAASATGDADVRLAFYG